MKLPENSAAPISATIPVLAYRVNAFCELIGISRTSFYELVKQKKIRTIVVAGRRLVPASEAERVAKEGA